MNARQEPAMATTPETFVDALNLAFGKQPTQRSAHAKGVVLLGKFVPSAEAASVSKALHFKHEVPVTVRFSANSGIPKIADAGSLPRFSLPTSSARLRRWPRLATGVGATCWTNMIRQYELSWHAFAGTR
jgi:hypothetical protein